MFLRLRRHQVLCAVGFDGQGYDSAYTSNMSHIVDGALRQWDGESVLIRITGDAGAICAPCPFRRGAGCESQKIVDDLDTRHGEALDISPGDMLTWGSCLDLVRTRIKPDDLDTLCAGCSWLDGGICKAAVSRLTKDRRGPPVGDPDEEAA